MDMKSTSFHCRWFRIPVLVCFTALAFSSVGCMTTYDAYGRPQQSVDPGLAVAGIAAAGLIGYALADGNNNDYRRHHGGHRGNYRSSCGSYGYGGHYRGYHGSHY